MTQLKPKRRTKIEETRMKRTKRERITHYIRSVQNVGFNCTHQLRVLELDFTDQHCHDLPSNKTLQEGAIGIRSPLANVRVLL